LCSRRDNRSALRGSTYQQRGQGIQWQRPHASQQGYPSGRCRSPRIQTLIRRAGFDVALFSGPLAPVPWGDCSGEGSSVRWSVTGKLELKQTRKLPSSGLLPPSPVRLRLTEVPEYQGVGVILRNIKTRQRGTPVVTSNRRFLTRASG
jgi:hypothetical protein